MRLPCFVVIASLAACGPMPAPRPRPASAQEFCAVAGAAAPTLHLIDLWPIPTDPLESNEVDPRLAAWMEAMQARIDLPWAKVDGPRRESFDPADGDAVRDQRLLLVQRGAQQQMPHHSPGRALGAPVWILELRDGRLRFIGNAPGRYRERATNVPTWEAVAGAAWRDYRFNPYVDLTPYDGWGKIDVFARGPTAFVDVANERITRR